MSGVLAALVVASCQAPSRAPVGSMVLAAPTGGLRVVVGGEAARAVQYMPAADWAWVECVLEHDDPAIAPQTVRADATVDSATGRRQAVVAFAHVPEGEGYRVRLSLKARDAAGQERVVAAFAKEAIAVGPGLTTVALADRVPAEAPSAAQKAGSLGTYVTTLSTGGPPARFRAPGAMVFDAAGRMIVLDETSIRLVSADAAGAPSVSTVAGSFYVAGYADGPGAEARFQALRGAVVAPSGAIYVTDGHRVRRVVRDEAGSATVTTVAGDALPGSADGDGASARFNTLTGITIDQQGTLYVIDAGNRTLRRIETGSDGAVTVSTLRDGEDPVPFITSMSAGLAMSGQQHLIVVTQAGIQRVKWNDHSPPTVTTLAGGTPGFADGSGAAARFSGPGGMAIDAEGAIYVADTGNGRIRRIALDGEGGAAVTTVAGTALSGRDDGPVATARFMQPSQVAVDAAGRVFVADETRIRLIAEDKLGGRVVSTYAGGLDNKAYQDGPALATIGFSPVDMAVDAAGTIYATEGHRIWRITADGLGRTATAVVAGDAQPGFADGPAAAARFRAPSAIAFDREGRLLVADTGNYRLRRLTFDAAGAATVATIAGTGTYGFQDGPVSQVGLAEIGSFAEGPAGDIYYAERYRIRKLSFDAEGRATVRTLAGTQFNQGVGFLDGPGTVARFGSVTGVAIDPSGTVFLADSSNNTIRTLVEHTSGAVTVSSIAGVGPLQVGYYQGISFADGRGSEAAFNVPGDLAIAADGTVYVADRNNHRVRAVTGRGASAWVTTLAGGVPGFKDGPAASALFHYPWRLALDARGQLYVLEGNGEMQLRKIAR